MIEEPLKAIISDLDPLVITAPSIRSGTTLLQRLLCSSHRALIYGELCGQDLEIFLNFYAFKSQQYNSRREEAAVALEQVLAGDVNNWIPGLMPEISGYLGAMGRAAFSGISYCREFAVHRGRPVWGFKQPAWSPATIHLMRSVMPRSRFIFIHRELKDCLKSAKAQGITYSKSEVEEFCRSWAGNRNYMLSLDGEAAVLSLQYDDLVRQPREAMAKLAEFTGIDDMDANVLHHKINTWVGEDYVMQAKNGYFEPAELNDVDLQIIEATEPVASALARTC